MDAQKYIISKQIQWAWNHDKPLTSSKRGRGRLAYTRELDQNLFKPLISDVRKSFEEGDGKEIKGNLSNPAKMQALHSSSALSVNVFQYWQRINQVPIIASTCGFCRKGNTASHKIVFEDKYPIDIEFIIPPNIDVVFHNSDSSQFKRFAVECKFSESYSSRGHGGLKPEYLCLPITTWSDTPNLYMFAKTISPTDNKFIFLHPAQLIKHILGLKAKFGKNGFKLLYLWYDALGSAGAIHREEINKFSKVASDDDVHFHSMSYQELIVELSKEYRQEHPDYIKYLTERYL